MFVTSGSMEMLIIHMCMLECRCMKLIVHGFNVYFFVYVSILTTNSSYQSAGGSKEDENQVTTSHSSITSQAL